LWKKGGSENWRVKGERIGKKTDGKNEKKNG
jgi:hypothetical protein